MGEDKTLSAAELADFTRDLYAEKRTDRNADIAMFKRLLDHISAQSAAIKAGEERKTDPRRVWSPEVRDAVGALEDKYDISVVSAEHHETWVIRCERTERELARLRTLLEAPSDEVVLRVANAINFFDNGEEYPPDEVDLRRARVAIAALSAAAFTEDKQT